MLDVRQHSLVIVPHDHLIRHEGKILKRHGRLVFAGEFFNATLYTGIQPLRNQDEPKPVKLMLRALPLIQTHVRGILAPSVVPE
jgi:histone deacetylase 6